MRRILWLVFVCLLAVVLVSSSCTQKAPEAPLTTAPTLEPTPVLTPTPLPSPPLVPATSDDDWSLWGPLKWPEEYKATKGANLGFVKKEEVTIDGKHAIIYFLTAVGLPKDRVYHLWLRSLSSPTPTEIALEVRIDDSGYLIKGQDRFQLGIQTPAKGEAMEFALMTVDKTTGSFGKIIPYPIESKQEPYRLWVELRSKKGDLFVIRGEGFEPNEEISFTSSSDGEVAKAKTKADSKGRLEITVLPAVAAKESGLAMCAVLGRYGEVKVSYAWGTEATKTATPPPTPTQTRPLPPLNAFMKGFNFADWAPFNPPPPPPPPPPAGPIPGRPPPPPSRGLYTPPVADQSLKNLAATGANWIALLVRGGQETIQSTDIFYESPATATDEALRRMIDLAHALGMRVMLKPHVHLSQDPTHGHVQIGTAFTTEEQWQAWFASYRQFIIHYATLARDAGADMFLIGQEMAGTVHRETDWRSIAQEVRQVYKGPIIYEATTLAADPSLSEDLRIKWWDAVDYIGVLGYFPLTQSNNPTVEDLKSAWVQRGYLSRLEALSQKYQKPIIISEIGYLSADGINTSPVPFSKFAQAPVDLQEQADCYQAALEVLWGKPWLAGIFWWQWFADPTEAGLIIDKDKSESPQGKPAEEVVRKFYLVEK